MAAFVNTFPRGASVGSFKAGVGPVGVTFLPAGPGERVFDTPGSFTFSVERGMVPMRVEVWSGGGGGTMSSTGLSACSGGGGGAFGSGVLGGGLIGVGSQLILHIGEGGAGATAVLAGHGGGSSYVFNDPKYLVHVVGGQPGAGGDDWTFDPAVIDVVRVPGGNPTLGTLGVESGNGGTGAHGGGVGGIGGGVGTTSPGSPLGGGGAGALFDAVHPAGAGARGRIRLVWPP